ncbi:MAG: 30S ribosomal protein S6, partial [Planctomycetales bacterium]|nr:30S ribosomal protein S6 [Planctomycetales bacterium]
MPANVYECLFLLDSNRYSRDPGGVASQVDELITGCEGEVLASRLWSEQKLAYEVNGHRKGTYWLSYFRIDSSKLTQLNRACQLNDNVIRQLTLKVDDRLADTLVQHAKGEGQTREPAETETAEEA